ncbi:type I restriction endonuclease [Gordonia sp. GONU]|uniref:type I restriction endonuclease subunit R n=1 Tax=Gordonia sp. GONU TaxID=2972949 RepID=UPI0021AD0E15|nr:type I restriction endonuclease [Gordonia sp. GONU]MCR8896799.1 type I restriction endonuclease [Gordonia sp. GONU]
MPQHHEVTLENEICEYLANQGWLYSPNDAGYDKSLALFPEDVFGWLADTQPEELAKRVKPELTGKARADAESKVLATLTKRLGADLKAGGGTLNVLRGGFKDLNAKFLMCQFKPNTTLNETTAKRYAAVRLRVMRQVHYSSRNTNAIDLMLFVNGIPVATVELKTDFTQSITDAVRQYKKDRLPKGEPLLEFGRRTVVHFAVSNSEVQMTTKLAGDDTVFLPFNRGNDGHAGNPLNPDGSPASYLWEQIWERNTWLDILGRFMHLHIEEKIDPATNRKRRKETMLFPRFHQWDAVTKLIAAAKAEGPGNKYLIQHSAGSGKTNSISWLTHRLSVLHDDANRPVFDAVLVITDRTVLDSQLQEAIRQIDDTSGMVAHIDALSGSKSGKLAQALESGTKIIIVTIQTFPYALDIIRTGEGLEGRSFAVIADEAHSSQAGDASKQLKKVLTATELEDIEDGGSVDTEDVLAAEMTARAVATNISFFAFTATPKAKTLELFGRRPSADVPPEPFHLYSMQQAIEEGFILDVLRNYTPYKTAFRLSHNGRSYSTEDTDAGGTVVVDADPGADSQLVDKRDAIKSVMNWVRLHPTNIAQKVQIIVEHFRANVGWRLDGKAKAMVVTSSRMAAVRYKLAFDSYVANKGYTDVAALVAFSGDITDDVHGLDKVTETTMNPGLKGRDLRDAFATDEYQVMLVANKFQTGFDQPLLVAMYVDKRLSGVQAVQTLSRLNRTAPGKDQTFVIDFANAAEDVVDAFEPYFKATTLADVTDPNIVHATMAKLDATGIYQWAEVNGCAADFVANKGNNALTKWVTPAQHRFRDREREANNKGDTAALDGLDMFRKDVGTFNRQYDFLSQLFDYEDPDLEKLSIYLRYLAPVIRRENVQHAIDLSGVDFEYLRQNKQSTTSGRLEGGAELPPAGEGGGSGSVHDPELVELDEVIATINDLFEGDHSDADVRSVVTHLRDKLEESENLKTQARNNSQAQFEASPDIDIEFNGAVIEAMDAHSDLSAQILNNSVIRDKLVSELVPAIYRRLRVEHAP